MDKLSHLTHGGLVVGTSADGKQLYFTGEDTHSLIIGATRCGKTRNVVLPSLCLMALAGESMVLVDPKAELLLYSRPFLERLGYEVITIDFKWPKKSNRYNFLQPVIDAVNVGDMALAAMCARDVAAMMVPENTHTDPIWVDGQRSTLIMGILVVVVDNKTRPEFQNLANVQRFISNMCKPVGKRDTLPLAQYLADCPDEHPARIAMGVADIAPSKMRGSFYTSALTTLDLFGDENIAAMTSATDFDISATGARKRAIFIVLPDHKSTYYPLAALFVYQHYQALVEQSDLHGNRLPRRVNFVCDEFGNFVKIPDFDKCITVGGGRGIRFHLFLQDMNQLDEKYGDKLGKTIRANAETWIYLQSDDPSTLRELSEKLGKYTIKSPSLSSSTGGSGSASYNLTGRELLTSEEIKKIRRPYQLVMSRNDPIVCYAPDLSKTIFNTMLGLSSKEHNAALLMARSACRPEHTSKPKYWNVWDGYLRRLGSD